MQGIFFIKRFTRVPCILFLYMCLLAGCASLPARGPSFEAIVDPSQNNQDESVTSKDYKIIDLDDQSIRILGPRQMKSLVSYFGARVPGAPSTTIDIGDRLVINIWEASSDGLFSTADKKQTQVESVVEGTGKIFIPYAGHIDAAGFSVEQVRATIVQRFQGQAVEPQVQVLLTTNGSHKVAVVGDVSEPGRFDVPVSGLRLLEAIALAGGAKQATFESEIIVVRGTTNGTIRMDDVVRNPSGNIWLHPRDTIQVLHRPRSFTAFGAVTTQKLNSFTTENVTLAEALAQVGGLQDHAANTGGVFLFRFEPLSRLKKYDAQIKAKDRTKLIPIVYRLDFSKPQAFFLASRFMMQDKDVIYVANAPASELKKFITTVVSPVLAPTVAVAAATN